MTRLQVNHAALAANWQYLRDQAPSASCAAVVKANGYGLGIAHIAPPLWQAGCRTFFVAHAEEGVALRRLLPQATIIVLHGVRAQTADVLAQYELIPALKSHDDIRLWQKPGWLHVDTGMNRLGFAPDDLPAYDQALGVMSHFACSDEPVHFMNVQQLKAFRAVRAHYAGLPASLCNSSGIFLGPANHFDLLRPGVALYGVNPTPEQPNPMQPVVTVQVPVLQTRTIQAGETAGYGGTWMADRPTKLATIECGYADGFLRALSGRGMAAVQGVKVPFAGRVSMDLIILDVTDAPSVKVGDAVELIGPTISVDEVAQAAGTIGYEVLTSLKLRD